MEHSTVRLASLAPARTDWLLGGGAEAGFEERRLCLRTPRSYVRCVSGMKGEVAGSVGAVDSVHLHLQSVESPLLDAAALHRIVRRDRGKALREQRVDGRLD